MAETTAGLLESEWQAFREMLVRKQLNETEIGIIRLAFFHGARQPIIAAMHSPSAVVRMAMEMREYDREQMPEEGACTWRGASTS